MEMKQRTLKWLVVKRIALPDGFGCKMLIMVHEI